LFSSLHTWIPINRQNSSLADLFDVPFVIFPGHDFLVTSSHANVTKVTIYGEGTYIRVTSFEPGLVCSSAKRVDWMKSRAHKSFSLFSSGNIAFVIVVCAAYASAITALIYSWRSFLDCVVAVLIDVCISYYVLC